MAGRVAIIQSSYIPWRGSFAILAACDAFIFLDSVQFTRRDWRTRNRIKTPNGPLWLSVPVRQKGQYTAPIDAIEIADPDWSSRHLASIRASYARAPAFAAEFPALADAYAAIAAEPSLSAMNRHLTAWLCGRLGITTPLLRDVDLIDRARLDALDPTERLAELAAAVGADRYLSGPSARAYLQEDVFNRRGIAVEWMDYAGLHPYPQLWGDFEPAVSTIDALLNLGGADARRSLG